MTGPGFESIKARFLESRENGLNNYTTLTSFSSLRTRQDAEDE
jgi:hypothetical protein